MENKDKPRDDIVDSPAFKEYVEAKAVQTAVLGLAIARTGVNQMFRGIQERCDGIRAKVHAKKGRKRT